MTRLYLVRHGQTDWNAERRWQGQRDLALNAEGIRQAQAAARAFKTIPIDHVFSSDLARARDTAAPIADATGVPHIVLPSLRERPFGRWEGRTMEELLREFPEEMTDYRKDRDAFVPPGGQSWIEFAPKAVETLETVAEQYPDQRLVMVAHGGPLKAFINHVLGIERGPVNQFVLDNGSISSVVKLQHRVTGLFWWQVTALNVTCHLNGDGSIFG